jgi:hypothetical protein
MSWWWGFWLIVDALCIWRIYYRVFIDKQFLFWDWSGK